MKQFVIPDDWDEKIKDWQENHECKYRDDIFGRYVGTIGGADTYSFMPTSIGMVLTVRCACGSEIEFDDF